jgi:hypothetical protein
VLENLGHDKLHDSHIAFHERETRLSDFLSHTRCDNDQVGAFGNAVVRRSLDANTLMKGGSLAQILGFSLQFFFVDVDKSNAASYLLVENGVGNSHSDLTTSHDGDLLEPGSIFGELIRHVVFDGTLSERDGLDGAFQVQAGKVFLENILRTIAPGSEAG